jgi:hypothetical protein
LNLNSWVDLRNGFDDPESLLRLIAGAQGTAIEAAAAQRVLAGLSPYRGLLTFREQDAGLFFGRTRFVDELVRKVRRRTATNVVAVVGPSGSGKSSIVYAGLIPALRRERGMGDDSVWRIVDLRPYYEPLNQLALAFDPPPGEPGSMAWVAALNERAQLFIEGKLTLAQLVRYRLHDEPGSTRLLLYVDQWEELYTQAMPPEIRSDEDRTRARHAKLFIDLVLEGAAKSPCTFVLSVRSDFYPDLQTHDGLRIAVQENQISLGTMNEAELREVIERPPTTLGARVDPELTQRLVRDIGLDPASGRSNEYDIGKLPLLEYALEQAWAKRTGPRISQAEYSGLEQALKDRANALYDRLPTEHQAAAKRLFVSLVTPGEGREDTRARIEMPDDEATRRVIQTFAGGEARLIVTDEAGGHRSVEVCHEALIRHWDKLRVWVGENRDRLRAREFLKANKAEWLKHGRSPALLNLPSLYVEAARTLYEGPGDVVISEVRDYIEALLEHEREIDSAKKAGRRSLWTTTAAAVIWLAIGAGIVLTIIAWQVTSVIDKEITRTIEAEAEGLVRTFDEHGVKNLSTVIEKRKSEPGASLYLLTNAIGEPLAGNVEQIPTEVLLHPGFLPIMYRGAGSSDRGRQALVGVYILPGGFRLLIGHDLGDRASIVKVMERALAISLSVVVLTGVGAGFLVRRALKRMEE